MTLSRNTRRRLSLYVPAVLLIAGFSVLPAIVRRLSPTLKIRRFDVTKALQHEASKMLMDYVRIDTSNPPGLVREAAEFLGRAFACEGIPYEIVGDDPERPVIVARIKGQRPGEALLLLHHMDVVPAGDLSKWTVPPFAGQMGEGLGYHYLYGRGTQDMKGIGIANFFALAELRRSGITPLHDVVFVGEPAEETFHPELGVGWLMEKRPDLIEGVTDIFNEGGVNEVRLTEVEKWGIETMQKARIDMYAFAGTEKPLLELKELLMKQNETLDYCLAPAVAEYFAFAGPWRADFFGRLMIEPEKAFESDFFRMFAPEPFRALIKDMVYVGDPAAVGDGYRLWVAYTLLPGSSGDLYVSNFQTLANGLGARVEVFVKTPDSVGSPTSGRAYAALVEVLNLDHERVPVGPHVLDIQYTHSSWLRGKGFRVYGFSPFNVNYLDALKIHSENERINLELYVEGVERMKRVVREFATRP